MAKCIQIVGQGVPIRTTDEDAFQIVERDGDGQYCSKAFWREWYRPGPTFPEGREPACSARLESYRAGELNRYARGRS